MLNHIKRVLLILACLLVIVGLGSVILTGKKEGSKALSEEEMLRELQADLEGDGLLSGNESVPELIELMSMGVPPPDFLNAPSFELVSLNKESITLEQFRGKAVLLSFWTTW